MKSLDLYMKKKEMFEYFANEIEQAHSLGELNDVISVMECFTSGRQYEKLIKLAHEKIAENWEV